MRKKLTLFILLFLCVGLAFSTPVIAKAKVAFALLWTIDDMGWTTAHYKGIEYLKKELGDQIELSYTEKVLAANAEQVLRGYA
ncbi:MAG: BMP family ABC transporter substrate-binding protein, partial [Deltaproteobacteria bacterium]|nr:BMP family ABC transporter substrate-binding protein [Deltaproteobacteria bacterium]